MKEKSLIPLFVLYCLRKIRIEQKFCGVVCILQVDLTYEFKKVNNNINIIYTMSWKNFCKK